MMLCLSIEFRDISFANREFISNNTDVLEKTFSNLLEVHGFVALSTCARVEFYLDATDFSLVHWALKKTLEDLGSNADFDIQKNVIVHHGAKAIEHLFRVTAGLESQVIGETEILGQVRSALATARTSGRLTRPLELAFSRAIHVSRQARATFSIGQRSLIDSALSQTNLSNAQHAILIGTGNYAQVCAQSLRGNGITQIAVFSPSGRHNADLDVDYYLKFEDLVSELQKADLVVTCSGNDSPVITESQMSQVVGMRQSEITIVDLALSADISRDVDAIEGVKVLRLANINSLEGDFSQAQQIIAKGVSEVMPRITDTELDELIVTLRTHITKIVEQQLQSSVVDSALTHKLVQALLHAPTMRARRAAAAGRLDEIRTAFSSLFGIELFSDAKLMEMTITDLDLRSFEELLSVS